MVEDPDYASACLRWNAAQQNCRGGRANGNGDDDGNVDSDGLFAFRDNVSVYLFSTTAPCGDASMDLLISSKPSEHAVPWSMKNLKDDLEAGIPLGRGHFSVLGAVRRKPARGDAEATMSKSCTDKIALKQVLGTVGFPLDMLIRHRGGGAGARAGNTFLKAVVVYHDQYHDVGYARAFGNEGRMAIVERLGGKYFAVQVLPEEFQRFGFAKDVNDKSSKVTNLSAVMVAGQVDQSDIVEVIVNGVKQGYKQMDEKPGKASVVSRASMVKKMLEILDLMKVQHGDEYALPLQCMFGSYAEWKKCELRHERRSLKEKAVSELGGWVTNASEDNFNIDAH